MRKVACEIIRASCATVGPLDEDRITLFAGHRRGPHLEVRAMEASDDRVLLANIEGRTDVADDARRGGRGEREDPPDAEAARNNLIRRR